MRLEARRLGCDWVAVALMVGFDGFCWSGAGHKALEQLCNGIVRSYWSAGLKHGTMRWMISFTSGGYD